MDKWLEEAMTILAEAEALDIKYRRLSDTDRGVGYQAVDGIWSIIVFRFNVWTSRGVAHGYDGAVAKGMTIVHMTPEVAERIFKKASAV